MDPAASVGMSVDSESDEMRELREQIAELTATVAATALDNTKAKGGKPRYGGNNSQNTGSGTIPTQKSQASGGARTKSPSMCFWCGEVGHTMRYCFNKRQGKPRVDLANNQVALEQGYNPTFFDKRQRQTGNAARGSQPDTRSQGYPETAATSTGQADLAWIVQSMKDMQTRQDQMISRMTGSHYPQQAQAVTYYDPQMYQQPQLRHALHLTTPPPGVIPLPNPIIAQNQPTAGATTLPKNM